MVWIMVCHRASLLQLFRNDWTSWINLNYCSLGRLSSGPVIPARMASGPCKGGHGPCQLGKWSLSEWIVVPTSVTRGPYQRDRLVPTSVTNGPYQRDQGSLPAWPVGSYQRDQWSLPAWPVVPSSVTSGHYKRDQWSLPVWPLGPYQRDQWSLPAWAVVSARVTNEPSLASLDWVFGFLIT